MNEGDKVRFMKAINAAAVLFDKTLTAPVIDLYFRTLEDLPIEAVEGAIIRSLQDSKFFPRPAEIREYAAGSTADRAENAWNLFLDCLRVVGYYNSLWIEDGHFSYALESTFGGWLAATTQMHELSDEMITAKRKQFVSAYRIANNKQLSGRQNYFQGHHETNNRSTASSWKRGHFPDGKFSQPVGVLTGDSVSVLPMEFSAITGEIMDASMQMLKSGAYALALTANDQRPRLMPSPQKQLPESSPVSLEEAIETTGDDLQRRRLENLRRRLTTGGETIGGEPA